MPALAEGENRVLAVTDANKLVVSKFIEAVWREGRLDRLPEFWTADCINHADLAPKNRGLDALKEYHESFAHSFADFEGTDIALEQQVAENDRVVTQMVTRAVHKPTGRHVSLATIRIDGLTHGKIAEHWSVADVAGLMKQLA
jgi:predicted ester cyclase